MNSLKNQIAQVLTVKLMSCAFKQFLENLAHEKAAGPAPTFSPFHVLVAMESMADKPIGRNKLAENLRVGKGAVRTLIGRLKDAGIVEVSKVGCSLTIKGVKLWSECSSFFRKSEIEKNELAPTGHSFAVLVKNHGNEVKSGIEQRDAAITIGARSVTTMIFRKGCLVVPSVSDDMVADFPIAARQVMRFLQPEENDAIIISSADDSKKAEYSALAAAWTLIDGL